MIPVLKVRRYNGIKIYLLIFDETDSQWHFIDLEKLNVRWQSFTSKEEAISSLGDDLIEIYNFNLPEGDYYAKY